MNSITKNFIYNVVYQLMLIILPLITTPYISRVLGSEGIGVYAYTYTIANYFMLVAMLGVKNYGNRSVAVVRENKKLLSQTYWEIYGLQFGCSIVALSVYYIYIFMFVTEYKMIAIIQGIYVLSSMLDISWLFFGLEKFKVTVIRNMLIRITSLACVFIFVKTVDDLWKYAFIMSLGTLCSQWYLWLYLKKIVEWYRPRLTDITKHFRSEVILFIPIIAVSFYKMMDKIMLGQISTISQLGFYESAEKIVNIPLGVITALGVVMMPRMSNLAAKGEQKESNRYIYNSIILAMFLASGMMFGIAGIAEDFIPLFLGEEYISCIVLLRVMSPTIIFIAWANVIRTQYLIPNNRDYSFIASVVLGAVVNLSVNLLLIPRMDAMGAVIGTLCAEASVCICQTWMVRKNLEILRYIRDTVIFFVFGAMMLFFILWVHNQFSNNIIAVFLEIILGGVIYVLLSGGYYILINKKSGEGCRKKDEIYK